MTVHGARRRRRNSVPDAPMKWFLAGFDLFVAALLIGALLEHVRDTLVIFFAWLRDWLGRRCACEFRP